MHTRSGTPLYARTGYFEVKRGARYPAVAAEVTRDMDGRWAVTIDGVTSLELFECTSAEELYAECLVEGVNAFTHVLLSVWLFGTEIDKATYDERLLVSSWAKQNDPDHPAANPNRRIDLGTLPIANIF